MAVVSWRRADVAECLGLILVGDRNSLIEGTMNASRTFAAGHSSEMGL